MEENSLADEYLTICVALIISLVAGYIVKWTTFDTKAKRIYILAIILLSIAAITAIPYVKYISDNHPDIQVNPPPITARYSMPTAFGFSTSTSMTITLITYWVLIIGDRSINVLQGNRPRTRIQQHILTKKKRIIILSRRLTDVFHLHLLAGSALLICSIRIAAVFESLKNTTVFEELKINEALLSHLGRIWLVDLGILAVALITALQIKGPIKPYSLKKFRLLGWVLLDLIGISILFLSLYL